MTTSISGYTASASNSNANQPPQYYQPRSLLETKAEIDDIQRSNDPVSAIGSKHFAQYAEAHAYPKGLPPGEKSFTKLRNQGHLSPSRGSVSPESPVNLSPSLQAAAAKSLPPLITLADKIPPIAEIRPTTALAASVPLPGPRELIEHTSSKARTHEVAAPLPFGSTTKIVPLPVTTTRPLPMVDRNKIVARPAVILTAEEYSLQPSMAKSSKTMYTSHQSRIPATFHASNPSNSQTSYIDRTAEFRFPAQSGPDFISAIGNLNIPPGFTSVNPPGRSYVAKKRQGSHEEKNKASVGVDQFMLPAMNIGHPESRMYRTEPSRMQAPCPCPLDQDLSADHGQDQGGNSPASAAPDLRFVDLHKSVVIVDKQSDQVKRPRGRPPGSKTMKRKRAESELYDLSDLESESTGGKAKLPRIDVSPSLFIVFLQYL